jgi:hypothetical protein
VKAWRGFTPASLEAEAVRRGLTTPKTARIPQFKEGDAVQWKDGDGRIHTGEIESVPTLNGDFEPEYNVSINDMHSAKGGRLMPRLKESQLETVATPAPASHAGYPLKTIPRDADWTKKAGKNHDVATGDTVYSSDPTPIQGIFEGISFVNNLAVIRMADGRKVNRAPGELRLLNHNPATAPTPSDKDASALGNYLDSLHPPSLRDAADTVARKLLGGNITDDAFLGARKHLPCPILERVTKLAAAHKAWQDEYDKQHAGEPEPVDVSVQAAVQAIRNLNRPTPGERMAVENALVETQGNASEKHGIKFGMWPKWAADKATELIKAAAAEQPADPLALHAFIFWAIPLKAIVPMDLFPISLLAAAIALGVVDVGLAVLLGAWLYQERS